MDLMWILVIAGLLLVATIAWLSRGARDLSDLTVIIRKPDDTPGPYEHHGPYSPPVLSLVAQERIAGLKLLGVDEETAS